MIWPGPEQSLELYDLAKDPAESRDLAKDHPETVKRMRAKIESARSESREWPVTR